MDRRTTLKWVLAASAVGRLGLRPAVGLAGPPATSPAAAAASSQGYGTDPDLVTSYERGHFWPLTLTPAQRTLATVLCDLIIPADQHSPAASSVGVVDFVDEWISAPYPEYQQDRKVVLDGFAWLDAESQRRARQIFAQLPPATQHAICDEICDIARAKPDRREAAKFFARYRNLTAGGFYCTPAGRQDVGYIGNVALKSFEAPPRALLEKLKLV
jgi:hypothetical protein